MAIDINSKRPESQGSRLKSLAEMQLFAGKPNSRDRMRITEQLALLLETGTSLFEALNTIRIQTVDAALCGILDDLIESVSDGKPFSVALERHPELFPVSYTKLVTAAEAGGFLHKVLEQLLEMDERSDRLRGEVKSAMSYPVFLMVFSVAVVVFVLMVVFPKFGDLFDNIRDQLPATTLIFMAASDLLRDYWWAFAAAIGGIFIGVRFWLQGSSGRIWLDGVKLSAPLLKNIYVQIYLVQSLRVMGLSLSNGVSVMDTLTACREVVENSVFRRFIQKVEERVQSGEGLAAAFQDADFLPIAVRHMISTGEATGNLAKVMTRVAAFHERELDKQLKMVSRMAEPVMLIVMGGVVGLIVSSLILPIFKLSQAVG